MKMKIQLSLVALILATTVIAQPKNTSHASQTWLAYFNQTRLSNKWGLWADFQIRTREELVSDFSTGIARVGVTYFIDDNVRLTLGYGFINNYPPNDNIKVSQPEHRPWQQVQWFTKNKRTRLMQYIRLEQRYRRRYLNNSELADSYAFNFRLRYNFFYQIPLDPQGLIPKKLSAIVNDELHINFGKQIVNNYFDQNRLFLGLNYAFDNNNNLQFGYLNTFIQTAAGNQYRNINALRVAYVHNLDLRKK
ncbi:MAG: DUF2490 domain-containing protein [Sediminibacterium sp. Gen4]|jgi:hypothetical protein|uniref:DUF2490 domain-containing protein n=1 Tax=unclassified Sediminibacterium TaxID=2635961 RepID=UPI0015BE4175|nr:MULTISPECIES: DUF2490 domain-containing protein [unclassified Sediminibacterium]MBW0161431.1 DUF2490 domain-containing protein [Sediminibacterium sp.]MBW0164687.1 DUF2490 domain-containing protein [Sediminibacterium sp.]NWK65995.1 DUF2490 domain-containing protein [Sediminibacterium sp. Gen4]